MDQNAQVRRDIEQYEEEHKKWFLGEMGTLLTSYMSGMSCLPGTNQSEQQAVREVTEKLEKTINDAYSKYQLADGIEARRREKQQNLLKSYRLVGADGRYIGQEEESVDFIANRIKKWTEMLSGGNGSFVAPDAVRALESARARLENARTLAIQNNIPLNLVMVSMPSLAAAFHSDSIERYIFMNWPPVTDMGTVTFEEAERLINSDTQWYLVSQHFAKKVDGSPSTTLEVFKALSPMIFPESERYRIEDLGAFLMWEGRKIGDKAPFAAPSTFSDQAQFNFELVLNPSNPKPRFFTLFARDTMESFIKEVTTGKWKERYTLLRLHSTAYRDYSEIIDRVDEDFVLRTTDTAHVFGNYVLCDNKDPNNDVFIDAYPSPSGMVTGLVEESNRNKSLRRFRGITEVSNAMQLRPTKTHWINPASKGIVGFKKEFDPEDLIRDSSEFDQIQQGDGSMPSFGHYKDIPMVPSLEADLDRRSSLSSVAKTRIKEAQEEKDDEMDLSGGQ